jgi:hypothetical protein
LFEPVRGDTVDGIAVRTDQVNRLCHGQLLPV